MKRVERVCIAGMCSVLGLVFSLPKLAAQVPPASTANASTQVVIEREPVELIPAKSYQVPLALAPLKELKLVAGMDGAVFRLACKKGDRLVTEAEAVVLDDRELKLEEEQATALHRVAEIELRLAKAGSNPDTIEIAEAQLQAAKAGMELAKIRVGRTVVRAPFEGRVQRMMVLPGQWVRAGEPVVHLADTSKFTVEIPVDRRDENSAVGKTVQLTIDEESVTGTIQSVDPPAERFYPLRDLVDSLATATVVVENPDNKLTLGQSVQCPLIPRHPVCEVSKASLKTQDDGTWKLQVIRNHIVTDLTVAAMSRLGEKRLYVSGPFAAGDEVIVKSSQDLPDGTEVAHDTSPQSGSASRPGTAAQPTNLPKFLPTPDE